MNQNQVLTRINYAEIGEAISHDLAAKMVKDFQDARPNEVSSLVIGRNIIEQILAIPGCKAIRFFNAINPETGNQTLVYAAMDEKGNTITEFTTVNKDGQLARVEALIGDRANIGGGESTSTSSSWF